MHHTLTALENTGFDNSLFSLFLFEHIAKLSLFGRLIYGPLQIFHFLKAVGQRNPKNSFFYFKYKFCKIETKFMVQSLLNRVFYVFIPEKIVKSLKISLNI